MVWMQLVTSCINHLLMIWMCGRMYLISIRYGCSISRQHIQILCFATFLIGRHRTGKASHWVAISLLVLRISWFELNIFGVKCIIFRILISLTRWPCLSITSDSVHSSATIKKVKLFISFAVWRNAVWFFLNGRLRATPFHWADSVWNLLHHDLLLLSSTQSNRSHMIAIRCVVNRFRSRNKIICLISLIKTRSSRFFKHHLFTALELLCNWYNVFAVDGCPMWILCSRCTRHHLVSFVFLAGSGGLRRRSAKL